MNARVLWCLVRDTFRQARASRVSWLMLGVSALCVALCLSLKVEGGRDVRTAEDIGLYGPNDQPLSDKGPAPGHLTLAFGGIRLPIFRDAEGEIGLVRVLLAKWIAGALGTLLALVWTAGFLPEFLQPGAASVLLAKPVSRSVVLIGKYLGVILFVGAQAAVFVVGTWVALGARTGDWSSGYLWCLPLLVVQFAVVYAASTLLAVSTRNTMACAFGSLVFWVICFAMNQGRLAAQQVGSTSPRVGMEVSGGFRMAREAAYWILPKPADLSVLLDRAVGASGHFASAAELGGASFDPLMSVATSLAIALVNQGMAAYELRRLEY